MFVDDIRIYQVGLHQDPYWWRGDEKLLCFDLPSTSEEHLTHGAPTSSQWCPDDAAAVGGSMDLGDQWSLLKYCNVSIAVSLAPP